MAGAVEVLALSDDEDTSRSKFRIPSRLGTRHCTPITPGNVLCLDSDDESEIECTPIVPAKVRWGGTFSELDDCCVVKSIPSSSEADGRVKSIAIGKLSEEDDCSIVKELASSSSKIPPRDTREPAVISDVGIQGPDPFASQILTDWTPYWSPDFTPEAEVEVEEPRSKRQKITDASFLGCDFDTTLETAEDPCSVGTLRLSDDFPPTLDSDMTQQTGHDNDEDPCRVGATQSALKRQKLSEEDRQRRLREKELEFERKQAERAEKKKEKEEAKRRQQEEIKQKKEDEKARKAAAKKAAADRRKAEQDVARFNSKAALKQMVTFVDSQVAVKGLIGGQLLSRLGQKNFTVKVEKNPLENSITWSTKRPSLESLDSSGSEIGSQDEVTGSQVVYEDIDIQYLIFIFEADEFSSMVAESSFYDHVRKTQLLYPGYTICYVVNRLTAFLKKKDHNKYQAPHDPVKAGWQRPPVEKALAGLVTNFTGVHSRLCVDEAEVAEHVTGLMPTLADSCYRPKLTKLSVCKNGDHVQCDDVFKEEIRKSQWLKALVAIPKVSSPCAVSIGRTYPNMRSLLKVYLDKDKTDREKELLLQDLHRTTIFGSSGSQRRIGTVCSKQIFNVLMAQDGNMKVGEVE